MTTITELAPQLDEAEAQAPIKALTIYQPWAALIAHKLKVYETRTWADAYRGPLAIHAGRTRESMQWLITDRRDARANLIRAELMARDDYWRTAHVYGAIIAVGTLSAIFRTESMVPHISEREKLFGNYGEKRFGWEITNVVLLPEPIAVAGATGLWDWTPPAEVASLINVSGPAQQTELDPS